MWGGDDFIVIQEDPHRDEECGVGQRSPERLQFRGPALLQQRGQGIADASMRENRRGRMECFPMITVCRSGS